MTNNSERINSRGLARRTHKKGINKQELAGRNRQEKSIKQLVKMIRKAQSLKEFLGNSHIRASEKNKRDDYARQLTFKTLAGDNPTVETNSLQELLERIQ